MTLADRQNMRDALRNHPRADDAIFWYCHFWHNGDDALYKVMCSMEHYRPYPWSPNPARPNATPNPYYDPELAGLVDQLTCGFNQVIEPALMPVRLVDLRENHILTAGSRFPCIANRWPCRVFKHHGAFVVECAVMHGIEPLPGSQLYPHPLREDDKGFVIGFRR